MACNPVTISFLESRWTASDLPIIVQIENDKFPVNNTDVAVAYGSVTNSGGFAQLNLSASGFFSKGSYVTVTGSIYAGTYQVRAYSTNLVTIDAVFLGTDTGTVNRFYSNYHVRIRVYSGIRSGHSLAADRPMAYRGEIQARPDAANKATVDLSSLVRPDLSPIDNHFCELEFVNGWANDTAMWTQFYFEFAESYDVVDSNGVLSTYVSPYTIQEDEEGDPIIYSVIKAANSFQYFQGKSMAEFAINPNGYDGAGRFLTRFQRPTYFEGRQWDVAIINDYRNSEFVTPHRLVLVEKTAAGATIATTYYEMPEDDEGVYRWTPDVHSFNSATDHFTLAVNYDRDGSDSFNTQSLTVNYRVSCAARPIYLRWLNQIGGWDSWLFERNQERQLVTSNRVTVRRDIFANYDAVFTQGTTQDDYISTEAQEQVSIVSGWVNDDERHQLEFWLKSSNKVQEIYPNPADNCGNDIQRTVLIEPGTYAFFNTRKQANEVELSFRYTDQVILPGQ